MSQFAQEFEILDALCNGIDPRNGNTLLTPKDPDLDALRIRLRAKLRKLCNSSQIGGIKKTPPHKKSVSKDIAAENQVDVSTTDFETQPFHNGTKRYGQKWTELESERMHSLWATGHSAESIGSILGRTRRSILERLVKDKVFTTTDEASEADLSQPYKFTKGLK